MELLRKLSRLGITPDTPASQARYSFLSNIAGISGVITTVLYAPGLYVHGGPVHVAVILGQLPFWALPLWFNYRHHPWFATNTLVVGGLLWFPGQAFLFGPELGHHYFLLCVIAGAGLVYRRVHRRSMFVAMVSSAAMFLVVIIWGDTIAVDVLGDGSGPLLPIKPGAELLIEVQTLTGVMAVLALVVSYSRFRTLHAEDEAQHEFEKSERLLRNILPDPIALRLKESHDSIADSFEEVTVMFADISGFTPLSAELGAEQVVDLLNQVFSKFDEIADRHGLEKIKTIGDAYMVAGGLPTHRDDHAEAVARMALEMLDVPHQIEGVKTVEMRIGIHTGPVVAGVIGRKKFAYDMWGDTVNTAARMESHGLPGEIQVTQATYERLAPGFELEGRGAVDIKGKGQMRTYFLRGARS